MHLFREIHGNRRSKSVLTATTAQLADLEIFMMSHDSHQTVVTRFISAQCSDWYELQLRFMACFSTCKYFMNQIHIGMGARKAE